MSQRRSTEKKVVFSAIAAALLLIVITAMFAPAQDEDNPQPSTYNAGPQGAKAAFLLLGKLGWHTQRFDKPLSAMAELDPAHTTFVLATPWGTSSQEDQKALNAFLERGGRVLADGWYGGDILPGVYWKNAETDHVEPRCDTAPEGTSTLAAVGTLRMETDLLAKDDMPETEVAQECPAGAAVIAYHVGKGTAIWWASPEPLTNRGLHEASNVNLLMSSIGPLDRTVVFDESPRDFQPESLWSKAKGLPITAMVLQLLLATLFLVLAFGRRHGPVRTLNVTPRTSPLEFAYSMGGLYHRAGAGEAATVEARGRLLSVLERECGISRETLRSDSERVAAELSARFNFNDPALAQTLDESAVTERIPPARALQLVQELHRLREAVQRAAGRAVHRPTSPLPQEKPRV